MELETKEMNVELESSIEGVEINRKRQKVCLASFIVFIVLATLYNGSWHSNCCMVTPAHLKVASSLPTFSGWVPGQDRGQVATIAVATRDIEDSSNHSGS